MSFKHHPFFIVTTKVTVANSFATSQWRPPVALIVAMYVSTGLGYLMVAT
ncbi:MAG TPA: hypothetical protein VEH86_04010 [Candidatus Acidoferrum sp.]|nr:hypothetical protein [Candidatus Acidoferrum sp.]